MNQMPSTASYAGLFFAEWLAILCYFYLDIADGTFGAFSLFWGVLYAVSLAIGHSQKSEVGKFAKTTQRIIFTLAMLLLLFMVLNGLFYIRPIVVLLGLMQTAYNFTLRSRRELHLSCLVALVMVIYICCSVRADWTLLFYVIPFLAAMVFTLASDEIGQRINEIRRLGAGYAVLGGTTWAVFSATTIILACSAMLYLITPQVHLTDLSWRFGEAAVPQNSGNTDVSVAQGLALEPATPPQDGVSTRSDGLTPAQIRLAALREGMPRWQAALMNSLADLLEASISLRQDLHADLAGLMELLQKLANGYRQLLLLLFGALLLVAILVFLRRELRILCSVLRTRWDSYSVYWQRGTARQRVLAIYRRMERLFAHHGEQRTTLLTAREYAGQLTARWPAFAAEIELLSMIFEKARYSTEEINKYQAEQAKKAYLQVYLQLAQH